MFEPSNQPVEFLGKPIEFLRFDDGDIFVSLSQVYQILRNQPDRDPNSLESVYPKLLTAEDVAAILGITAEEVDYLASEGRIGFVELTETKKAYTLDLVAEYIEAVTYRRRSEWDSMKLAMENF